MKAKPPDMPRLGIGAPDGGLPRSRSVLLLVDFINPLGFPGAEPLLAPALAAAQATAALKQRLVRDGVPVIYANDNYGIWRSEFSDILAYCKRLKGERGAIARLLAPRDGDLTILKPRHSGFFATPLELLLGQMHAKRLILVGLAADICVQLTAMDAHLRGFTLWVPTDCTAAESPEFKQSAIEYMARVLKADVRASAAQRGR